jgi:hypothetical protein
MEEILCTYFGIVYERLTSLKFLPHLYNFIRNRSFANDLLFIITSA